MATLICFDLENLSKNDFSFLLTEQQRIIIANLVNNEILCFANGISEPLLPLTIEEISEDVDDLDKLERRLMGKREVSLLRNREKSALA